MGLIVAEERKEKPPGQTNRSAARNLFIESRREGIDRLLEKRK